MGKPKTLIHVVGKPRTLIGVLNRTWNTFQCTGQAKNTDQCPEQATEHFTSVLAKPRTPLSLHRAEHLTSVVNRPRTLTGAVNRLRTLIKVGNNAQTRISVRSRPRKTYQCTEQTARTHWHAHTHLSVSLSNWIFWAINYNCELWLSTAGLQPCWQGQSTSLSPHTHTHGRISNFPFH